jgi:hypothetical protein
MDWDALAHEFHYPATPEERLALAEYIQRRLPLEVALRSHNAAMRWLRPGQYIAVARLDDSAEYWRIVQQLRRRGDRC